jgi:hypothetical protein
MDASIAATVCTAAPEWFWFGLLLLLSFTLLAAPFFECVECADRSGPSHYYRLFRLRGQALAVGKRKWFLALQRHVDD